jgi:EAL domain-containing protein (putative c-di-GMP-specific phosphodiesterase class I)
MFNDLQKQDEFFRTVKLIQASGSEVICTKLESRADSFLSMRAGVSLGQGFLFARPAGIPQKNAA